MRGRTIIPFFPFLFFVVVALLQIFFFFFGGRRGSGVLGFWDLESGVWSLGSGVGGLGKRRVVSHLCVPLRRIFGFFSFFHPLSSLYCILKLLWRVSMYFFFYWLQNFLVLYITLCYVYVPSQLEMMRLILAHLGYCYGCIGFSSLLVWRGGRRGGGKGNPGV